MPYSHLATATNILWKLLEAYDQDPATVFQGAGIEPDLLKMPGARIRYAAVNRAWRRATELIDDACFGLQGPNFWHPSYLYALGYAWLASHSLREALKRFVLYLDIVALPEEQDTVAAFALLNVYLVGRVVDQQGVERRPTRAFDVCSVGLAIDDDLSCSTEPYRKGLALETDDVGHRPRTSHRPAIFQPFVGGP